MTEGKIATPAEGGLASIYGYRFLDGIGFFYSYKFIYTIAIFTFTPLSIPKPSPMPEMREWFVIIKG
jgi:hypothetical protein